MNQRGSSLEVDGYQGPVSVAEIKAFQRDQGLVDDGQVGPLTWPHLVYEPQEVVADGSHVRALQTVMNKRSAGVEVDGDFGPIMHTAVSNLRTANRLVSDGQAGPITLQALVG